MQVWGLVGGLFFPFLSKKSNFVFQNFHYTEKFCGEGSLGSVWDEPPLLMSGERIKSSAPIFFSLPPSKDTELKGVFQKTWRRES